MTTNRIHTSMVVKNSPFKYHTYFDAVFNDDGTPYGSIRNLAIQKTQEKWGGIWHGRLSLEIYYHDKDGNEVSIENLEKKE